MNESLMEHTRRLMRESKQSTGEIYAGMLAQGSDVTYYWLRNFSAGRTKDPSVNRVEELYQYLTGKSVLSPTAQ